MAHLRPSAPYANAHALQEPGARLQRAARRVGTPARTAQIVIADVSTRGSDSQAPRPSPLAPRPSPLAPILPLSAPARGVTLLVSAFSDVVVMSGRGSAAPGAYLIIPPVWEWGLNRKRVVRGMLRCSLAHATLLPTDFPTAQPACNLHEMKERDAEHCPRTGQSLHHYSNSFNGKFRPYSSNGSGGGRGST